MAEEQVSVAAPTGGAWRIGVDVGGTFTDLVLVNEDSEVRVFKVPSDTSDPAVGVLAGLALAAERLSLSLPDLLRDCPLFVHGTTIATNTVLEGKGATVGLLCTDGFRDSLEIRRGYRENPWDHRTPYPPVLVPRYLRLPVAGRINRDGVETEALNEADIKAAGKVFASEGVEAVAVCLFNSYLNPDHERHAAETMRKIRNDAWVFSSTDIAPTMGEYERTSTSVMNAYVAPRTVGYLRRLDEQLRELGFQHSMLLIQNNGGAVSVEQLAGRPVTMLLSGPAAGVGALGFYSRTAGSDNMISMEIGGTSCDVILMRKGDVSVTDQFKVGGYDLALPSVDVHTIGAGGGTIAGVDAAGMLFAGPQGAGARPGPAAYGFGGTEPTVTDAQIVLGRLKGGPYAGGAVTLDETLARRAVEDVVAKPLGIDAETAAAGIIRLVEQNLLQAVQQISLERGHDPRQFVLVAGGGAGPMHGAIIGRQLGCPKTYIPRLSGVFCALGMLHSDVRHDFLRAHLGRLDEVELNEIDAMFAVLMEQARDSLTTGGFVAETMRLERELDLRYVGQQWDVRVRLDNGTALDMTRVRDIFEDEHERLFGHRQPGGIIEMTKLRVVATGLLPRMPIQEGKTADGAPQPMERRRVYLDAERGWVELDVYAGDTLRAGHRIAGPLLIEEQTTTVFVGPDDILEVDAAGDFMIELPSSEHDVA